VISGAGVGRAGKRKQRHNSKGSNLHDHLLHKSRERETIASSFGSIGWRLRAARGRIDYSLIRSKHARDLGRRPLSFAYPMDQRRCCTVTRR
jgi:hypothetical protein